MRNCESELNLMTTDFFASMSFTVMLLLAASMETDSPRDIAKFPGDNFFRRQFLAIGAACAARAQLVAGLDLVDGPFLRIGKLH